MTSADAEHLWRVLEHETKPWQCRCGEMFNVSRNGGNTVFVWHSDTDGMHIVLYCPVCHDSLYALDRERLEMPEAVTDEPDVPLDMT